MASSQTAWLRRNLPLMRTLGGAAAVPVVVIALLRGHLWMAAAMFHFAVVGAAALLAALSAVTLSVVARRRNDGRAALLGLAFSVMTVLLLFHAVATPGVLVGVNGVVSLTVALGLPTGGWILALSSLPALRRPRMVDQLLAVQVAVIAVLIAVGTLALVDTGLLPGMPAAGSVPSKIVFVLGALPLALVAVRSARTAALTHRPADAITAAGVVWLIAALYALMIIPGMDAAWWAGHVFEVAGIGLVGIPAALDLRHASASRPLVGDLRAEDLVADEAAYLGGRVRALMVRLAEKDPSTEGHTRRVATLAVQLGEELRLPQSRLRLLALGGLLHDIGKLSTPDAVLKKPGALTDEVFAVIREHPTAGRELLADLGGFPDLVCDLVEGHHERLDGEGYPNRRSAGEMDLEVRILAVADVFDALTADRVYRPAWSVDRALALLVEGCDSAFDAACVQALQRVRGERTGAPALSAVA